MEETTELMDLRVERTTSGSEAARGQSDLLRFKSKAGLAGLILALSMGFLPVDGNLVTHATAKTSDTASLLTIHQEVSSADILRALANLHDRMLASVVDLDVAARNVLYEQLWNLYE